MINKKGPASWKKRSALFDVHTILLNAVGRNRVFHDSTKSRSVLVGSIAGALSPEQALSVNIAASANPIALLLIIFPSFFRNKF